MSILSQIYMYVILGMSETDYSHDAQLQKITLLHRIAGVKASKPKKTAKEKHEDALAEIVHFYKNPKNLKMFTAKKARRDKLKSLAPKLAFKKIKPGICQTCRKKKCPSFCELQ